jgi:hypothetical protein
MVHTRGRHPLTFNPILGPKSAVSPTTVPAGDFQKSTLHLPHIRPSLTNIHQSTCSNGIKGAVSGFPARERRKGQLERRTWKRPRPSRSAASANRKLKMRRRFVGLHRRSMKSATYVPTHATRPNPSGCVGLAYDVEQLLSAKRHKRQRAFVASQRNAPTKDASETPLIPRNPIKSATYPPPRNPRKSPNMRRLFLACVTVLARV